MTISAPNYPPAEGGYPYLASFGLPIWTLAGACLKEGVVKGIDSLSSNLVTVEVESVEYEGVPVYVHTDKGARSRKEEETDPLEDPAGYFEDAARMFTLHSGVAMQKAQFGTEGPNHWPQASRDPRVTVVMSTDDEGNPTALCVVNVIDNGTFYPAFIGHERRTSAFPTYKPYIIIREKVDTTKTFSLYDPFTGTYPNIPNPTFTAYVQAKELDSDDYDDLWVRAFQLMNPGYTLSGCGIDAHGIIETPDYFFDTRPEYDGWTTEGWCYCEPVTYYEYDGDPEYGYKTWIRTDYSTTNLTCNGNPQNNLVTYCEAESACDNASGYYEFTQTWECNGSVAQISGKSGTVTIPHAHRWFNYLSADEITGYLDFDWDGGDRVDSVDFSVELTRSGTGASISVDRTMYINGVEAFSMTGTGGYSGALDHRVYAKAYCVEGASTMYFDFSMFSLLVYNPSNYFLGDIEHNTPAMTGINLSSLVTFVHDRYDEMFTDNPTVDAEDILLEVGVMFIPYDIRERGIA